jgi:hypothetical protein
MRNLHLLAHAHERRRDKQHLDPRKVIGAEVNERGSGIVENGNTKDV